MIWRRLLIITAVVVALYVSALICLQLQYNGAEPLVSLTQGSIISDNDNLPKMFPYLVAKYPTDLAEACYPFRWQKAQQERLRSLLQLPETAPSGTEELALAGYARYAETHENENIFREGIRREPRNALYHYLLADLYLKQALRGEWPKSDKKIATFHYEYTIVDRNKLDEGMRELAIGLKLPLLTHRDALIKAQLAAMPPERDMADQLQRLTVVASIKMPEYSKIRNFARVNGFYLSTLLSEGKRAEAEPFLHTGEYLVVQLSNDHPLSLISQLVAAAVAAICEKYDAHVCRSFGLNDEAAMIVARQERLSGKLQEFQLRGLNEEEKNIDDLLLKHAGIIPSILLPLKGSHPTGLITSESLRPSRLVEYVKVEKVMATGFSVFALLLMVYTGLIYWHWKLASRGTGTPVSEIVIAPSVWVTVVGWGLLVPLALYLIFIAIPTISWRNQGIQYAPPFFTGVFIFMLWTLIVPANIAAGYLRKQCISVGLLTVNRPWRTRFGRSLNALLGAIWSYFALVLVLGPIIWALHALVLGHSPFNSSTQVVMLCLMGAVMLEIPFIPLIWTRKDNASAPFQLAMARSMITVYAVMALFFAALVPICSAFERHYVQTDQLLMTKNIDEGIGFTRVEGQIVVILRNGVREGATQLGIPWE